MEAIAMFQSSLVTVVTVVVFQSNEYITSFIQGKKKQLPKTLTKFYAMLLLQLQ